MACRASKLGGRRKPDEYSYSVETTSEVYMSEKAVERELKQSLQAKGIGIDRKTIQEVTPPTALNYALGLLSISGIVFAIYWIQLTGADLKEKDEANAVPVFADICGTAANDLKSIFFPNSECYEMPDSMREIQDLNRRTMRKKIPRSTYSLINDLNKEFFGEEPGPAPAETAAERVARENLEARNTGKPESASLPLAP